MADTFVLNTQNMDTSAQGCQTLADQMLDTKSQLESLKSQLAFDWAGDGHNEFEKQFRLLAQQLTDVTDTLYETAENILAAEEAYIQADTTAAQAIDGVQQGVLTDASEQITGIEIA